LRLFDIDVPDGDVGAFCGEAEHDCAADVRTAAGDDDRFAFEIEIHIDSLWLGCRKIVLLPV